LGYDRWPTGYGLAAELEKRGLLSEWACLSSSVPFVAALSTGAYAVFAIKSFGLSAVVVVAEAAGSVPLPPGRVPKRAFALRRLYMIEKLPPRLLGGSRGPKAELEVALVEATLPHVKSPLLRVAYKGKAALAKVGGVTLTGSPFPSPSSIAGLVEALAEALREVSAAPRREKVSALSSLKRKLRQALGARWGRGKPKLKRGQKLREGRRERWRGRSKGARKEGGGKEERGDERRGEEEAGPGAWSRPIGWVPGRSPS